MCCCAAREETRSSGPCNVVDLIGKMKLTELGGDLARSLVLYRKRPGAGVRASLERRLLRRRSRPARPAWLNSAFVGAHGSAGSV